MNNLFLIRTVNFDGSDHFYLYVAETGKEAAKKALDRFEGQIYTAYPYPLYEVNGYEVKLIKKEATNE